MATEQEQLFPAGNGSREIPDFSGVKEFPAAQVGHIQNDEARADGVEKQGMNGAVNDFEREVTRQTAVAVAERQRRAEDEGKPERMTMRRRGYVDETTRKAQDPAYQVERRESVPNGTAAVPLRSEKSKAEIDREEWEKTKDFQAAFMGTTDSL